MFVKRLKTQAYKCEFPELRDMMILVRCVFGIKDIHLKEKLLQNRKVNLVRADDLIRASEVTRTQVAKRSGERSNAAVQSDVKSVFKEPPIPSPRKINGCKFRGYDHVKEK